MKKEENGLTISHPLRVELNFLRQFIFTLNDKKIGTKERVAVLTEERINGDGSKEKATLIIETDLEYGLGGPFDYRAFRTVEKILSDVYMLDGELSAGPICLGKEHTILKLMGYKQRPSEKEYERLKIFFMRMQRMKFFSEHATFNAQKNKWAEGYETLEPIYKKVVFTHKKMPDDTIADAVYVWLGDHYLASLNKRYIAIIDFNFYSSIKSLSARRLYEIISLYAHKHSMVYLWYSDICARMQICRERYLSAAKRNLRKKYQELCDKGFLQVVTWPDQDPKLKVREYEGSPDWIIRFDINKNYKAQVVLQPELRLVGKGAANKSESEQERLQRFKVFFSKKYRRKFGRDPFISAKDEEAVKPLLRAYSNDDMAKLVRQFFLSADPAITQSSYAISYFASTGIINKLNIEISASEEYANDKKPSAEQKINDGEQVGTVDVREFMRNFVGAED